MILELFVRGLYTRTAVARHPCFSWAFLSWECCGQQMFGCHALECICHNEASFLDLHKRWWVVCWMMLLNYYWHRHMIC